MTTFADIFAKDGPIGRKLYAQTWLLLVFGAYNIHRLMAGMQHVRWTPVDYVAPLVEGFGRVSPMLYAGALLVAAPAVYLLVVLTRRRVAELGLASAWTLLALVPGVNLWWFALLSLLPDRGAPGDWFTAPGERAGSALRASVACLPPALTLIGAAAYGTDGVGLLLWGLPFLAGLGGVLLYSYACPASFGECLWVGLKSVALLLVFVVAAMFEAYFYALVTAPIWGAAGAAGVLVGYGVQKAVHWA